MDRYGLTWYGSSRSTTRVRQRERLTRWPVTLQSISIAGAVDNVQSGISLRRVEAFPRNGDDLKTERKTPTSVLSCFFVGFLIADASAVFAYAFGNPWCWIGKNRLRDSG